MNWKEYENSLEDKKEERESAMGKRKKQNGSNDTVKEEFKISLEIEESVFKKIMYWIRKSNFEVSGLGKVEVNQEENSIRVIDAILLPQKNTSTTTDLDAGAISKAMFLLKDTPGELRWWWHSHVNMDAFWSGTDDNTIKRLGLGGWFVATVLNKREEMKSAYSQSSPLRLFLDDIQTSLIQYEQEIPKEWEEEYEKNVENMKPQESKVVYGFRQQDFEDRDIEAFIKAWQRKQKKEEKKKENGDTSTEIDLSKDELKDELRKLDISPSMFIDPLNY